MAIVEEAVPAPTTAVPPALEKPGVAPAARSPAGPNGSPRPSVKPEGPTLVERPWAAPAPKPSRPTPIPFPAPVAATSKAQPAREAPAASIEAPGSSPERVPPDPSSPSSP